MDYSIPVISMFSPDIILFGVSCAVIFFVIITAIAARLVKFSQIKTGAFATIASASLFFGSLFSLLFAGQYAYQFGQNIIVLHQVVEEANNFDAPLNPELSAIFSEFKEGQSADGLKEEFNLYSELSTRLRSQMDLINSSVRGEDYANMKDFLSLCFPGESGSDLYLTMGSYPPKELDLKSQAEKAMMSYSQLNTSEAYPSGSEIPHSCVVSYLVPDFL